MLSQWTYVHQDDASATVNATLNNVIEIEGVTSLVHQVGALSTSAVNSIDIMGWGGGITDNTTLVRSCFKFLQNIYGVFAIIQESLDASSVCYAGTFDASGNVSLWKDSIASILSGAATPLATTTGPVGAPNLNDTWGLSLMTQYNSSIGKTQLTLATTIAALALPIVLPPGQFPTVVSENTVVVPPASVPGLIMLVDANPLIGGVNAGIFSAQAGSFVASTNLDDFDVTQIFIT